MKKINIFRWLVLFLAGCAVVSSTGYGTYVEKRFVVVKDRGQDVLCDPYMVKENDYVFKVFREKGEIASSDLSWFMEIFKRLNPDVQDVNLIYPNQRILIPLKIIDSGSLEGQETGVVSIPLITITNIPVKIQGKSTQHIVAEGDSVSKLLARQFGASGGRTYKEAEQIFKFLNPDIKDPNKIIVGQKINLPVASIKDEPWYPGLFDESGKLVVTEEAAAKAAPVPAPESTTEPFEKTEPPEIPEPMQFAQLPEMSELSEIAPLSQIEPLPETAELAELPEIADLPEILEPEPIPEPVEIAAKIPPTETVAEKAPELASLQKETPIPEPEPAPFLSAQAPSTMGPTIFRKAARILGAELMDQGEYFFPRQGYEDLKLDLLVTPVMEFKSGQKALLTQGDDLSVSDQDVIQTFWKNLIVVNLPEQADIRDLLTPLCPIVHRGGCENKISFDDRGINVSVQGEYIFDKEYEPGKTCLTLIEIEDQKTPNAFQLYLASMTIDVSEWIDSGSYFGPVKRYASSGPAAQPAATLSAGATSQEFIRQLASVFGYKYEEQIEVSFDYAGFKVKTLSNLLSAGPGKEVLVDFGDFQGDALKSVEATGFRVVQVKPSEDALTVLKNLMQSLSISFKENPTFWAAERRRIHNPSFQAPGLLVEYSNNPEEFGILLSFAPIHPHLISFLNQSGIRVVRMAQ
jgi:hypothetical protein